MAAQHLQLQRVVGVTFDERAQHVRQLRIGDAVWLQIDDTNPFDPSAVVVTPQGISRGLSQRRTVQGSGGI